MRQLGSIIAIEEFPDRGHEDILVIEERDTEVKEIGDLMRVLINANFPVDTFDLDEVRKNGLFDEVITVGKPAKGDIHVIEGLAKDVDGGTVVAVELEELDGRDRKGLEVPVIVLNRGFINDDLTIRYIIITKV